MKTTDALKTVAVVAGIGVVGYAIYRAVKGVEGFLGGLGGLVSTPFYFMQNVRETIQKTAEQASETITSIIPPVAPPKVIPTGDNYIFEPKGIYSFALSVPREGVLTTPTLQTTMVARDVWWEGISEAEKLSAVLQKPIETINVAAETIKSAGVELKPIAPVDPQKTMLMGGGRISTALYLTEKAREAEIKRIEQEFAPWTEIERRRTG